MELNPELMAYRELDFFRTRAVPRETVTNGIKRNLSVTVLATPEETFNFWRDFKNFPIFMNEVAEVHMLSPRLSRWTVKMKNAPDMVWDAEIIAERRNEMISWQSIGDSIIKQAGSVWFKKAPADLGTVVSLHITYNIPGGKLTELATKLSGEDPETLILNHLKRFKAYIETGEIPTIEGQPNGKDADHINKNALN